MLTETEARELLARAAATIDVTAADPDLVSPARRRRWVVPLIAAAATVAVIVTGVALTRDSSTSDAPPATGPGPTLRHHPNQFPGRIPSVFAFDAPSAERLLANRGLTVTTRPSYTCDTAGRAVRTNPAAGTRFAPGDSVRLFVTAQGTLDCGRAALGSVAWQVLDFANHRGPAPAFASEVSVYVDDKLTTMTAIEAADPDTWGPGTALGLLAASTRQVMRENGAVITPYLTVGTGIPSACGGESLPSGLTRQQATWFAVEFPWPGVNGPCTIGQIYQSNGRIHALVVGTSHSLHQDHAQPGGESDSDPDGIGARFLAYARGETDELPVDTAVRLYLGNEYQKTINASDIADRTSWDLCAVYAERGCPPPMSAVTVLREAAGEPSKEDSLPPDICLNPLAELPPDTGGTQVVVLGATGISSCIDDFSVQIWSNDLGQITAVNLLLGSP
jgi:hypothetical protein